MKKGFVIGILFGVLLLLPSINVANYIQSNCSTYNYSTYNSYNLIHYIGSTKTPSLLLLPGMFENHMVFDFNNERNLARYLNSKGWDVWIMDYRAHDADGDPGIIYENEENMDKYWDFDGTYLEDLNSAIDKIRNKNGYNKVVLIGHSMGGYLAYAYAEKYSQYKIAGIITIGSVGEAVRTDLAFKALRFIYGRKIGNRVYVRSMAPCNLDPNNRAIMREGVRSEVFYRSVTERWIQNRYIESLDDEPAGIVVDMLFGFDKNFKKGHWCDPQTHYDYTSNLCRIKVPIFLIAGDKDKQDPPKHVKAVYYKVKSEDKKFKVYKGYGHVDMLLSSKAKREIFPDINNWLVERMGKPRKSFD